MKPSKNKSSGSGEAPKKASPLSWVVALAAAGGVVIGSAGTYFLTKPSAAQTRSPSPTAGGMPQAQSAPVSGGPAIPPLQQFTPAPQPPGTPPPGRVWSAEHGHWHDVPSASSTLSVPVPAAVPAAPPTPAPVAVPAEKKE